ncbi:MAG: DUF3990 domain-containing protein [Bacteroidales bacterium]|nr:DUF3990 domain-containing protein [Bacteroidales bacterium]
MKLFHGSIEEIKVPRILETQRLLDFGRGFYTTSMKPQAESWALIKQKRFSGNSDAIVTVYEIEDSVFFAGEFKVKDFQAADEEWLDFIVANRRSYNPHPYDIVKGVVANDSLYSTLLLYEANVLTKLETIERLKTHKLFDQISFHNNTILKELKYIESYFVSKNVIS